MRRRERRTRRGRGVRTGTATDAGRQAILSGSAPTRRRTGGAFAAGRLIQRGMRVAETKEEEEVAANYFWPKTRRISRSFAPAVKPVRNTAGCSIASFTD